MFWKMIVTAAVTSLAGTAIAADAGRPVVFQSAPAIAPEPTLAGDLSLAAGGLFYGGGWLWGTVSTLARVNIPLSGNKNLEVEAGGGANIYGGGSTQPTYVNAVTHLWGTHSPSAAWGVFGGAVSGFGPIGWVGGVEAKHFFANGSLGVSAAAVRCYWCGGETVGAFTASFNHYVNPNTRIGIRGGIFTNFSLATWEVGADVEHRFTHPVSLFAEAMYLGGDGPSGFWAAKGGVRFYLDDQGDTLQSYEKKVPWTTWVPAVWGFFN